MDWFESGLTKGMSDVRSKFGRECLRRSYIDLIGEVLQKGQVCGTPNQRACMIRCVNVDEARGVCKKRNRWLFVVSAPLR